MSTDTTVFLLAVTSPGLVDSAVRSERRTGD